MNVSPPGGNDVSPTAMRLICLAASRYRSRWVGVMPSAPATLSKP